jgi:hypothetical protein
MTLKFSKIPLLILCCVSIVPVVFINLPPNFWAYLNILVILFFSLWAYSVTTILLAQNKYDENIKFWKFVSALVFVDIYTVALSIYYSLTYNTDDPKWFLLVVIIGHFLLSYNFFYILRFISKALATAELKRTVTITNYFNYIFMLLFFPVGIWWLYPKIQTVAMR